MRINLRSIFLAMIALGAWIAPAVYADNAAGMDRENGPLENLQVILLALSAVAFLVPVARAERSYRCVLLGGAMLSFSFILRELDVEDLAVPQWVILMSSGTGRDVLLGSGWAVVGVLSFKVFSDIKKNFRAILLSRTTVLIFVSGLILFSGSFFDHKDDKTSADQLAEEIIELAGYTIFLLGAVFSKCTARMLSEKETNQGPIR